MNGAHQPIADVAWFHIDDPNSAALDELAQRYQLHPLQIEDCRHAPQRSKVEEHAEYLFVVLKHLHDVKEQEIDFDDLDAFIGPNFLLRFRQETANSWSASARERGKTRSRARTNFST
jgi:magnesium transporter